MVSRIVKAKQEMKKRKNIAPLKCLRLEMSHFLSHSHLPNLSLGAILIPSKAVNAAILSPEGVQTRPKRGGPQHGTIKFL